MKRTFMYLFIAFAIVLAVSVPAAKAEQISFADISREQILSSREISLTNRHRVASVGNVFKDNILLNLAYLSGKATNAKPVDWQKVREPAIYEFTLKPGEVFAFHDNVKPEYQGRVVKTTNAHFSEQEGFLFSGLYYGDGVCHFASLIYWAAKDAGLKTESPVDHDFAVIPEIPDEYGVSIFYSFGSYETNMRQNLYIENAFDYPVTIRFQNAYDKLKVSVVKGI